jgi:hypothetical protein
VASLPGRENQSFGSVFRTILSSGSIPSLVARRAKRARLLRDASTEPGKEMHRKRKRKRQHRRIARQTTPPTKTRTRAAASTTPPVPSGERDAEAGSGKSRGLAGWTSSRSRVVLHVISTSTRDLVRTAEGIGRHQTAVAAPWIEGFVAPASVVGRAQRRILNEPVAVWCHHHA